MAILIALPLMAEPFVLWLVSSERLVDGLIGMVYGEDAPRTPDGPAEVRLRIDGDASIAQVDEKFLSVAVDTSQVVGGHWWAENAEVELKKGQHRTEPFDFSSPRLRTLAQGLAPAYLRIGGSEADEVGYDLGEGPRPGEASDMELVLTRDQWDAVGEFARDTGLSIFFTANAAAYDRVDGAFDGQHLERLLAYTQRKGYPVDVWELGNEVNVYWFTQGLRQHLTADRYAGDYGRFASLVRQYFPQARVAATGAFVWPVMGEPPPVMLPKLMKAAGEQLDVVTWHYYPQQSRRCWSATRRARQGLLLEPAYLDEFDRWAGYVEKLRDRHAPQAAVWLGESGGAQCGGEPGISDRYESSLWWLDQLGLQARRGQPVAVRQTLAGSHYGMIDLDSMTPRPDYWASWLWKQLMGTRVLNVEASGNPRLRTYAQCSGDGAAGSVTLLAINLDAKREVDVAFDALSTDDAKVYAVTATSLDAGEIALNGETLRMHDSELPALAPSEAALVDGSLRLAPSSYAFVVLPRAHADACQGAVPAAASASR